MPSFYAALLGCALILPHLLCEIRCFLSNLLWRSLKIVRMSDRKSWFWKCGTASDMLHFLIMPMFGSLKCKIGKSMVPSIDLKSSNLEVDIKYHCSLHTQAINLEHEIVRAQKECPKAFPRHFQNHVMWSHALNCSVELYVTGTSTNYYFKEFYLCWVLTNDKI